MWERADVTRVRFLCPPRSACSRPCGGGLRTQRFRVARRAEAGGAPCGSSAGELRAERCNAELCPLACLDEGLPSLPLNISLNILVYMEDPYM